MHREKYSNIYCARVEDPHKKVPDLYCEVLDLLLEVVDLKRGAGSEIRRDPPQFNPWLLGLGSVWIRLGSVTGAVPAMKPEATVIGDPQGGRRKITLSFDGRRFCVPKFRH